MVRKNHDHGLIVNLYQIKKMLGDESDTIGNIEYIMVQSYNMDDPYVSNRKKMSFAEYVNKKRHWLASVLGIAKYI